MKRIRAGVSAALAGGSLLLTAGTANASVEHTHLRVLVKTVTPDPVAIDFNHPRGHGDARCACRKSRAR